MNNPSNRMIGILQLIGRRRRKHKAGARADGQGSRTFLLFSSSLFLVPVLLSVPLSTGCGSGAATQVGPAPSSGPCVGQMMTQPPACCTNPSGSGCSTHTPGHGAVGFRIAGAAYSGHTATLALSSAGLLNGPGGTAANRNLGLADGQGATAGNVASGANPAASTGSGGAGSANGGSGGSGAGGGAFGGRSSSLSATGSLSTAPMPDASPTDPGSSGNGLGGGYTSGSGAGAIAGNGAGLHPASGMGIDGAQGSSSSEASFGADTSGADGKTMDSEDPSDYFTRIGLGDNIFKIVERRYRQKSMAWASLELNGATGTAPASTAKKPGALK